jgi:hypothetical protein
LHVACCTTQLAQNTHTSHAQQVQIVAGGCKRTLANSTHACNLAQARTQFPSRSLSVSVSVSVCVCVCLSLSLSVSLSFVECVDTYDQGQEREMHNLQGTICKAQSATLGRRLAPPPVACNWKSKACKTCKAHLTSLEIRADYLQQLQQHSHATPSTALDH